MSHPHHRFVAACLLVVSSLLSAPNALAYPLDGYAETGIRRLEYSRLANEGVVEGDKQPPGALLRMDQVRLALVDYPDLEVPEPDEEFTSDVVALLGEQADRYSLLILDLTDLGNPLYAEHRPQEKQNVGSVGKIISALGLYQTLADVYPDSIGQRQAVLRDSIITADAFSQTDHHSIKIFNVETYELIKRPMQIGDQGSMWEYLDWMLSVSSNSAAGMVMRDAMLLRNFGTEYPIPETTIVEFFSGTPAPALTALFQQTFWEPVERSGMNLEEIRQGSIFTASGQRRVSGGGLSYATPRALLQYLLLMEQGLLIDPWSSLELKRMLYVTERRIRYASSPALARAAVYSKSGSLFSCEPEEGFICYPYHGNVRNYMNSINIVEHEVGGVRLYYLVVLISNVLRVNSAVTHQTMATEVHNLIRTRHGIDPAAR
jgi:hypothetical protein